MSADLIVTLEKHLQIKEENRNQNWDEVFFKLISDSHLKILSEDPQEGPDGWPYIMTETLVQDKNLQIKKNQTESDMGEFTDSTQKILHWLSSKGIGLAVNPQKRPYPDYVFSYGMIWSFRETGFFIKYNEISVNKDFIVNDPKAIKVGPPTEAYLPNYVRDILRQFLRDQGVLAPKILLIAVDGEHYDLCFSLESFGNPPESEHADILEAIAWFLPPHYSIALVSDKGFSDFALL